eukprot:Partr_v1_DN25628_c0_g1_i1_m4435 putative complex I
MSLAQKHYRPSIAYLRSYLRNSYGFLKSTITDTLFLRPFDGPVSENVVYDAKSGGVRQWGIGADQELGGFSTANLSMTKDDKLKFSGTISLALKPGSEAMYSGFTAMRTRSFLPARIFAGRTIDCSKWNFVLMRIRGDHRSYSFNFKTDNTFAGDLYSCKFKFRKPYEWEDVILPFQYFIRNNCGVEYMRQYPPNMEKITSFGFLLSDSLPGPYSLELDSIRLVNTSDEAFKNACGTDEAVTRNLADPKKIRKDWEDASSNYFGFGMDMADGVIETPAMYAKRFKPVSNARVHNPDWVVKVRPTGRPASSADVKKNARL